MDMKNDMNYALYLRKSRADLDAEARGEGETLAKHRAALTAFARRRGLLITREYAEIVSGDTIAARPQMQALLADVKAGLYAGVIVNDVDRLGRGDSIDQEIIKYTFAASHTLIITPNRDIDPANPSDDDMLDFSMFLARFEYKKIAQRMRQGRIRSAAAGRWIATAPPYGYRINADLRLEPDPDRAPVVRMVFDWYASGEIGYDLIARRLNDMGLKSARGNRFVARSIQEMLHNPAYIGHVVWGKQTLVSVIEDGRKVKRRRKAEPIVHENAHEPLVSRETWDAVQARKLKAPPVKRERKIVNPLAGILYCSECGKMMVRSISPPARERIVCFTQDCPTSGADLSVVEDALIEALRAWCAAYEHIEEPPAHDYTAERDALTRQLSTVSDQIRRAQELVEMSVYSPAEYIQRRAELDAKRASLTAELDRISAPAPARKSEIVDRILSVIDAYPLAQTPEQKNALLKTILSRVVYHKSVKAKRGETGSEYITLDVYPSLTSTI